MDKEQLWIDMVKKNFNSIKKKHEKKERVTSMPCRNDNNSRDLHIKKW